VRMQPAIEEQHNMCAIELAFKSPETRNTLLVMKLQMSFAIRSIMHIENLHTQNSTAPQYNHSQNTNSIHWAKRPITLRNDRVGKITGSLQLTVITIFHNSSSNFLHSWQVLMKLNKVHWQGSHYSKATFNFLLFTQ
jgi:hypothetical protein